MQTSFKMRSHFLSLTSLRSLRPSCTRTNFVRFSSYVSIQSDPEQKAINEMMIKFLDGKRPLKGKFKQTTTKMLHSDDTIAKAEIDKEEKGRPEKGKSKKGKREKDKSEDDKPEDGKFVYELHSFKFSEALYKAHNFPMPIRARGLHVTRVNSERVDENKVKFTGIQSMDKTWEGDWKIILRGYDKYFNVGEVPYTKWPNIPSHSVGPYYATAKENGCLILISALPPPSTDPSAPPQIIVSSKNKIGGDHSVVGQNWLKKHLESCSPPQKIEDLAKELYEKNITVACELCDDGFEEHVLEYSPERTGLHVHGLNRNTVGFETLPMEEVLEFSNRWGFLKPRWKTFDTVEEVKEFTDSVRRNGANWDGTNLEGFVARGIRKDVDHEHGPAFFWKIKYDEPYMMYREWREVTKMFLESHKKSKKSHWPGRQTGFLIKKYRHGLTKKYVEWLVKVFKVHPEWFARYTSNHGIIDVRKKFLAHMEESEGKSHREIIDIAVQEHQEKRDYHFPDLKATTDYTRTIIATIAVPGSGKTLLSVALSKLFNFGHIQSDNMKRTKGKAFEENIMKTLHDKVVVIADKNNHLIKHRQVIMNLKGRAKNHRVRTIALAFDTGTIDKEKLLEICGGRITSRGLNHQTLRPDAENTHLKVINKFIETAEPLDPEANLSDKFDHVIRVGVEEDISTKLRKVVKELTSILNLEMPTEEAMDNAVKDALDYVPSVFPEEKPTQVDFDYFAILIDDFKIRPFMEKIFKDQGSNLQSPYQKIEKKNGWKGNPHVTLVHSNDIKLSFEKQKLWCQYEQLCRPDIVSGEDRAVEVTVGPKLLWDSRIMCVEVSSIESSSPSIKIPLEPNLPAHITLGQLLGKSIKKDMKKVEPVEAKLLLQAFREGKKTTPLGGQIRHIDIEPMVLSGWLSGCYKNLKKQKFHLISPKIPKYD